MELLKKEILGKTVMNNCCGFLKVEHPKVSWEDERVNLLDTTRVNIINHRQYVKKLLIDIYNHKWDRTLPKSRKQHILNKLLRNVFREPKKLNSRNFQLKNFVDSLTQGGHSSIILLLKSIIKELLAPFRDNRFPIDRLDDEELFYHLIKETKDTFR